MAVCPGHGARSRRVKDGYTIAVVFKLCHFCNSRGLGQELGAFRARSSCKGHRQLKKQGTWQQIRLGRRKSSSNLEKHASDSIVAPEPPLARCYGSKTQHQFETFRGASRRSSGADMSDPREEQAGEGMIVEAFGWMRPPGAPWRRDAPSREDDPPPYCGQLVPTFRNRSWPRSQTDVSFSVRAQYACGLATCLQAMHAASPVAKVPWGDLEHPISSAKMCILRQGHSNRG